MFRCRLSCSLVALLRFAFMSSDRLPAGHIDIASWSELSGWAWFPDEPMRRAVLEIIHDDVVMCRVVANLPRKDLADAGVGDGENGFALTLPKHAFNESVVRLSIREASTGVDLHGSPIFLTNNRPDASNIQAQVTSFVRHWVHDAGEQDALSMALFFLRQFDVAACHHQAISRTPTGLVTRWADALRDDGGFSAPLVASLASLSETVGICGFLVPSSSTPEITIIIPVYNHVLYTLSCIQSIIVNPPTRTFELIIVDDGSSDETLLLPAVVRGVTMLRNERNQGFSGSVVAGVNAARGRWLFLMNNDTEATPCWLDELCNTLERDSTIGVAGSKLIGRDGLLQEAGGIIWRQGDGANWGWGGDPDDPRYCYLREADYVSGAALMIERAVWNEVGGFTAELCPAYYEDTDLCFNIRASGRRVVVQPQSRVIHHGGVSAGTDVEGSGMKRHQRVNQQRFTKRWADTLSSHGLSGGDGQIEVDRYVSKHVLFVDDSVPTPDRDAGSNAIFEHMLSFQRLGYQVHFVPADNMARLPPHTQELERRGIRCYYRPYNRSVEEVLQSCRSLFDVVYVHRAANAAMYLAMIRATNPTARLLYSVANLHFLRMQPESDLRADPKLQVAAATMQTMELAAVAKADEVIVHSTFEANALRAQIPDLRVSTIAWTVEACATKILFQARSGVAFIGSFNHAPNRDAIGWLISRVMPRVWQLDPMIVLSVLGATCLGSSTS